MFEDGPVTAKFRFSVAPAYLQQYLEHYQYPFSTEEPTERFQASATK
jgi:hypothetical protein